MAQADPLRRRSPRGGAPRRRGGGRRAANSTFGVVVEDFLKRHVKGQRRAAQVEREIRRELIPVWKDKQVGEITRSDVVDADRGHRRPARAVSGA